MKRDDGSYLISGWMPAVQFASLLGIALPASRPYQTFAGFLLQEFGHSRCRQQDHRERMAVRNRRSRRPPHRQGFGHATGKLPERLHWPRPVDNPAAPGCGRRDRRPPHAIDGRRRLPTDGKTSCGSPLSAPAILASRPSICCGNAMSLSPGSSCTMLRTGWSAPPRPPGSKWSCRPIPNSSRLRRSRRTPT